MFQRIRFKIPGFKPFYVYVRVARRSCEHICFIGALMDCGSYAIHLEPFALVLFGKAAFAMGAAGVYLFHYEEHVFHVHDLPTLENPEPVK
jgi:hypothetical protein